MSFRKSRLLVVAGVALGLVGLGATTATATTPHLWTVSAGSAPTGSMPQFIGTSAPMFFQDLTSERFLGCSSGSTKLDVTAVGTDLSGNHIAKVSGSQTTWNGCTSVGGYQFTVTSTRFWDVNALTYDKLRGLTMGNVNNVHLALFSDALQCEATFQGAVAFQYDNNGQSLSLVTTRFDRLMVATADCGSTFAPGDSIYMSATYQLSPVNAKNAPLVVTHP